MRNLLIVIKVLILGIFLAQKPASIKIRTDTSSNVNETKDSIAYLMNKNNKEIEEVKNMKLKNDDALVSLKKLEFQKKELMKTNSKLIDQLIKIKTTREVISNDKKKALSLLSKIDYKIDSTCISYTRTRILGKKKCDKWEYFKYINLKDTEVLLK